MTVAQPLSSFDQSALPPHPVRRWMRSGNSGVSGGTGVSFNTFYVINCERILNVGWFEWCQWCKVWNEMLLCEWREMFVGGNVCRICSAPMAYWFMFSWNLPCPVVPPVGCIFAELLLRRPFLQGNQTDISQLDKIFQVFGTPTESNWPDHNTLPLCTRGLEWDNCPPIPVNEIFTAAPQDCISLLRSMLVLDPNRRFTSSQCLNHPYFSNDPAPTPKEKLILSSE